MFKEKFFWLVIPVSLVFHPSHEPLWEGSDGTEKIKIANGHPMLSKVTGTGCMTSALVGAFAGAGSDYLSAAVAGIASMGIAGETAFQTAGTLGTGSFHVAIIDALSRLTAEELEKRVKIVE